jgi:hypothetical protein
VAFLSPEYGRAAHIDEELRSSAGVVDAKAAARRALAEVQNDGGRRRTRPLSADGWRI